MDYNYIAIDRTICLFKGEQFWKELTQDEHTIRLDPDLWIISKLEDKE